MGCEVFEGGDSVSWRAFISLPSFKVSSKNLSDMPQPVLSLGVDGAVNVKILYSCHAVLTDRKSVA